LDLPYDLYSLKEFLKYHGKWVVYGKRSELERLADFLAKSDEAIELLTGLKLSKHPVRKVEVQSSELGRPYVLIVYCDSRVKEKVERALRNAASKLGVKMAMKYKFDSETFRESHEARRELAKIYGTDVERIEELLA